MFAIYIILISNDGSIGRKKNKIKALLGKYANNIAYEIFINYTQFQLQYNQILQIFKSERKMKVKSAHQKFVFIISIDIFFI